jgi:hypothetical protein
MKYVKFVQHAMDMIPHGYKSLQSEILMAVALYLMLSTEKLLFP